MILLQTVATQLEGYYNSKRDYIWNGMLRKPLVVRYWDHSRCLLLVRFETDSWCTVVLNLSDQEFCQRRPRRLYVQRTSSGF